MAMQCEMENDNAWVTGMGRAMSRAIIKSPLATFSGLYYNKSVQSPFKPETGFFQSTPAATARRHEELIAMKKMNPFNLLGGIVALFCVMTLYIPIIAPAFSRAYSSVVQFSFRSGHPVVGSMPGKLIVSANAILLMYWAILCFMGIPGKTGLPASIVNLAVTAAALACMAPGMLACRVHVLVVAALDIVASIVLAAAQFRTTE